MHHLLAGLAVPLKNQQTDNKDPVWAATVYFCRTVREMTVAFWDSEVLWLSREGGDSTEGQYKACKFTQT